MNWSHHNLLSFLCSFPKAWSMSRMDSLSCDSSMKVTSFLVSHISLCTSWNGWLKPKHDQYDVFEGHELCAPKKQNLGDSVCRNASNFSLNGILKFPYCVCVCGEIFIKYPIKKTEGLRCRAVGDHDDPSVNSTGHGFYKASSKTPSSNWSRRCISMFTITPNTLLWVFHVLVPVDKRLISIDNIPIWCKDRYTLWLLHQRGFFILRRRQFCCEV